ncbi:MAG: mechanosensitive ion channel [Chloroflexota bacterium]|nr:mechanosensitive ion channel [Chloroflexota bacterium]
MSAIQRSFVDYWRSGVEPNIAPVTVSLLQSIIVILVLLYIGRRLQRSWRAGVLSKSTSVNLGILIGRLTFLATILVAIVWVSVITGVHWSGFLTLLAGLSVAVAFAIQDILKNLVAGLYLLLERPFTIGDAISVKEFTGVVEDIQIRTTVLRTEDGQRVIVPNAVLFTDVVVNRREERTKTSTGETGSDAAAAQPAESRR